MESILSQIQRLAAEADHNSRYKLKLALRDAMYSLEDDDDIIRRVGYGPLETATIRTGIDLGLFDKLSLHKKPAGLDWLAAETKVEKVLLDRLLKHLAASGYISEMGLGEYTANNITAKLVTQGNKAGICHMFDTCGPLFLEMPRYLRKTGYVEPSDHMNTVWQDAFSTKAFVFDWMQDHPENLRYFNEFMAGRRKADESWLSVCDIEAETQGWPPDRPLFVNMGGGVGHQNAQFKARFPDTPGRHVLQDLPATIEKALQTPGVENMPHDFFTPQPIKGSRYYFLRGVLHNHPNDRVAEILGHIRDAMSDESTLLIDELVLPDAGAHALATGLDLTMMCAMASRERTESQWEAIFKKVGLRVVEKMSYKPSMYETLMKLERE